MPPSIINPSGRRLVVVLENTGPENMTNVERPDDIVPELKQFYGGFTSDMSRVNDLFLDSGQTTESTANRIVDASSINSQTTIRRIVGTGLVGGFLLKAAGYNDSSNSGMLDTRKQGRFLVKKSRSDVNQQNYDDINQIYNDVNQNLGESKFSRRVNEVLTDNNPLTNPDSPLIDVNKTFNELESKLTVGYTQKNNFGVHAPKNFPVVLTNTGTKILVEDLKKLGDVLMLRSSGELASAINVQEPSLILNTVVPGLARLGKKIPISSIKITEAYKTINPNYEESTSLIDDSDVTTYGNTNNPSATFTGFNSMPSLTLATALMLSIGGILKSIVALYKAHNSSLSAIPTNPVTETSDFYQNHSRKLGHSRVTVQTKDSLTSRFGVELNIVETKNDLIDCIDKGISVYFNSEDNRFFAANPLSAAQTISQNHGYYNTVLRQVIRSALDFSVPVVVSTINLSEGSGAKKQDVQNLVNSLNPVEIVNKLNSSPIIGFLNVIATIGDIALDSEFLQTNVLDRYNSINTSDALIDEKDPEGVGLNPAIVIAKGRLSDGKHAWRTESAKSLLILPESVVKSAERFNGSKKRDVEAFATNFHLGTNPADSRKTLLVTTDQSLTNGNRIKAEFLNKMEQHLEKDYVPFYFHDLRTNEIISFHAFLNSVSDGFDASYEETEGFGRIDQTMVYKNTRRSINVSFKLVALDEEDFDMMWYKLNKFITLVYPQWSEGRQLSWGVNNKITQPFSQHIAASPMVRLRLGDLFKTNYSKFSLARLFGISTDQSKFNLDRLSQLNNSNRDNDSTFLTQQQVAQRINSMIRNREQGDYSRGDILRVRPNGTGAAYVQGYSRVVPLEQQSAISVVNRTRRNNRTRDRGVFITGTQNRAVVQRSTPTDFVVTLLSPVGEDPGEFIVPRNQVLVDFEDVRSRVTRQVSTQNSNNNPNTAAETDERAVSSFLSDEGNPIFKAFSSVQGKGLAGFIKSIRLEPQTSHWTVDLYNSRAPQMLEVSFDFAPIHDIMPGIDSNGFMTSPIYNIGKINGKLASDNSTDYNVQETKFAEARKRLIYKT